MILCAQHGDSRFLARIAMEQSAANHLESMWLALMRKREVAVEA
jgi:hypothetical protein